MVAAMDPRIRISVQVAGGSMGLDSAKGTPKLNTHSFGVEIGARVRRTIRYTCISAHLVAAVIYS